MKEKGRERCRRKDSNTIRNLSIAAEINILIYKVSANQKITKLS